jgi:hypothetical protein
MASEDSGLLTSASSSPSRSFHTEAQQNRPTPAALPIIEA